MANLIIKPTSGGSLILQDEGGTAAHTIDASGNHTLSGTTNNIGTVTTGVLNGVTGALRSTASNTGRNVWNSTLTSQFSTNSTSLVDTGLALTVGTVTPAADFLVIFNEDRKEQSWNLTFSSYLYSVNGGSAWTALGENYGEWDAGNHSSSAGNLYQVRQGIYYLSIANNSDLRFKVQGARHGTSNSYFMNYTTGAKSSITAIKITQ